ncbi:MAG: hypothetical protein KAR22_06065 [Gammaproteobacteria bacterium]|nr:hypothetical protein [Gammaproteobacteria bacterium]
MTRIVFRHGGTTEKIVGDAVHAIFSAPKEQADHATLAVACAMEMDEISPWTAAVDEKAALP